MSNVRAVGGRAIVLLGLLAASVAVFAADAPGTGAQSQDPSIVCPPPMPPFLQVPCFDLDDKNSSTPIDEDSKRKIDDTNEHLRETRGGNYGLPSTVPSPGAIESLAAPANLTVIPGDGYLDISWTAVDGATGYDVQAQAAGSSSWIDVASVTGTSHRYTTSATIDYVRVRATNSSGVGNWTRVQRLPAADWLNTVQSAGGASASGGASIASGGSIAAKLDAPASITVTRDNYSVDEKLHVTWAAVTGATGYNLVCSDLNGWTWWQCGSITSGATTTLTIDTDSRSNRDLVWTRSYLVSVRAVTSNAADASDWVEATNAHPALQPTKQPNSTHASAIWFTREAGSITLSWISPLYGEGYEIECATGTGGGTYTRCADVEDANVTAGGTITATITSWTVSGTDYSIDDTSIYDIAVRTTNAWGKSPFTLAPLIHPVTLLNVSGVGPTAATLTLLNHTGNWYYKHTNTGATCEGPVSTTSKALTSLTANTTYAYSAYSDSSCATLLAAATPFTTVSSVSSLGSAKSGASEVSPATTQAVAFTTGASANGYVLKSITVPLRSASASGGTNGLQLKLYQMAGTGQYGTASTPAATALATLSGTAPTASAYADTTFTCSGSGCSLSANTVYFVVATFDGSGKYDWAYAATETQTAQPSGNGWDIEFGHFKEHSPSERDWHSYSDFNIAGLTFLTLPPPALTASNVAVTTATLTIANHTGNWYHKHTGAGATCDGPVSGTSKALTGLTANTTYTYSAYSDSSCTAGNLLATATGFTTFSSVSSLTSARSGDSIVSVQQQQAVAFTTGSNSGGYVLKSVTVPLKKRSGSSSLAVTATLHAMAGTGQYSTTTQVAATVLATLAGTTPTGATYADTTFTCAGSGCKLSSGATYFVVLASSAHPGYDWARATTETEVALPSGNGWSIGFGHYKQTAALDWGSVSTFNVAELVFTPNPTLTSSNVAATAATLTIANHAGQWWYKHTNTGATCDGPVAAGTSSVNLTGLTANTSYTYSAYSDSSCTTANLLATAAQFTTLVGDKVSVSNLDETLTALIVTLGPNAAFAQEFTTGNTTGAYKLTKVTVDFSTVINASAVTVAIHDRQSDGTPATTARATLTGTPALGQSEFTCSGSGCDLDANTSYFVHVSASAANAAYPSSAASNDQTLVPTGTGWSIADGARSEAGSWAEGANSLRIKVEATVEAKLTSSSITATGATLTIGGHTGQWWYKHTNTGATCQGPVAAGTSTKALTGLTSGTNYTYSAYSKSGCNSADLLATAALFKTLATLTSSNVAATTATLTIAGHTGAWYYKHTNTGATCGGPVAANTASKDLTGLTAGTAYTFSAYSDSSCSTLLATASQFTTSASLTASSVTGTGATLTLAGHTGNWWYQANRAPDATCSSTAETGTTKTLSSLTAGTVYAYTAYSASGCASANRIATAVFGTPTSVSVSNLNEPKGGGNIFPVQASNTVAQEFTTGSAAGGYTLSSATLNFGVVFTPNDITVAIHGKQSDGSPETTARATLSGTAANGNTPFTCTAGSNNNCSLAASTSYFIVVKGSTSAIAGYVDSTDRDGQALTPSGNGWSIADALRENSVEHGSSHAPRGSACRRRRRRARPWRRRRRR